MKKILIVEDDIPLNVGIGKSLTSKEISVDSAFNLDEGKEKLTNSYDLIILDINLPDGNGLDLLKEIRKKEETPVIILTARDMEIDEIKGLEMGANDYITKPFSLGILKARVSNQLRGSSSSNAYNVDDFSFDFENMKFFKGNDKLEFNKIEQKLLKLFLDNKNITLSRDKILDYIWTDSGEYVYENTLSVTIKRIRDKLEANPKNPKYIKTVYGIGYFWEDKK